MGGHSEAPIAKLAQAESQNIAHCLASTRASANPESMIQQYNDEMQKIVPAALRRLLCEKHLYQPVEVDLSPLIQVAIRINFARATSMSGVHVPEQPKSLEALVRSDQSCANIPWIISTSKFDELLSHAVHFALPSINTFCAICSARPPFNPKDELCSCVLDPTNPLNQWYNLAYECQQCKSTPVRFLVRREKLKLRLCGRDPIEAIPAPKVLPKAQSKFYSDAQIAHHAGQTLAAMFLLRTFIEQFWRSLAQVQELIKTQPRATGEEQGRVYQDALPTDFKNRFVSLSDIYGKLSAAMHEANADAALFEESCQRVEEHFDARRLFKITNGSWPSGR